MPAPRPAPQPNPDLPPNPKPAPKPIPDTPNGPNPAPSPDLPANPQPSPKPIPQGKAALPPEAQRALAEAEARRAAARPLDLPPELGGRDGPEPIRYGDWEKKGIAVDF